mmetsp:Transcript_36221/g.49726  ORF Transcript_36221/g.49726 Transcript_36221/m.49726 type:complete len:496 (-) Transcript_36221:286-1773(-)|eukprot:CAMPEP_0201490458 /NCGR_PEP_ID=MMETSP0151_2-20130828/26565_1 /ASSEMBLY_ACC=CAM_ASM_000257 /TAXON_ID=200890 /ORGANISM="Paramoeba atlantica, Strain 621/1 / CCAP 1560/9" /LENGTH=495 /DNA_ID=CAMNT_0047876427 /DNA_START=59 /DNA_END=1546 /DNA_ORIENTATION=+
MNRYKSFETDEAYVSFSDLESFGLECLLGLSRRVNLSKERSKALRQLLLHTLENHVEKLVKVDGEPNSDTEQEGEEVLSPPSSEDEYDSDEELDIDEEDMAIVEEPTLKSPNSIPSPSQELNLKVLGEKYQGVRFSLNRLRKELKDAYQHFENVNFENESNRFKIFQTAVQGKRNYMEDQICAIQNPSELLAFPDLEDVSYYGVYDGHGGACAAKYILRRLHSRVLAHEKFPRASNSSNVVSPISEVLHQEMCLLDTEFNDISERKGWKSGSTAVVSVIHGDTLVSACVGDSRSVLYVDGKPTIMNEAHSPGSEKEKARIEQIGGVVVHFAGAWRVNGVIGVSRSIGDPSFRTMLIPDPDIKDYTIKGADYMIMATDGLWDVVNENEVPALINNARIRGYKKAKLFAKMERQKKIKLQGADPASVPLEVGKENVDLSRILVKEALKRGSRDNISVIVVLFSPLPPVESLTPSSSSSSSSSMSSSSGSMANIMGNE